MASLLKQLKLRATSKLPSHKFCLLYQPWMASDSSNIPSLCSCKGQIGRNHLTVILQTRIRTESSSHHMPTGSYQVT